jgi:predicted peptidase
VLSGRRAAPWSFLLLVLAVLAAPSAHAAPPDSGRFVLRSIKLDGQRHRFAVWLPPGYERRTGWPAVVFLHGAGECGDDGLRPTRIGLGPALAGHPERWPFVVVFPQKPAEQEEWEEREGLVLAVLNRVARDFTIDPSRVALAGLSQGGHGVWAIGARHPTRWACLVPICGYGRAKTVSSRVAKLPVWAFHGLRDDIVDPEETRAIVAAIRAERARLGLDPAEARMTLYEDANHNSWDPALAEPELPGWLAIHLAADGSKAGARERR